MSISNKIKALILWAACLLFLIFQITRIHRRLISENDPGFIKRSPAIIEQSGILIPTNAVILKAIENPREGGSFEWVLYVKMPNRFLIPSKYEVVNTTDSSKLIKKILEQLIGRSVGAINSVTGFINNDSMPEKFPSQWNGSLIEADNGEYLEIHKCPLK